VIAGHQLAAAAEALVGSPFRLHGRDPATGLDCVGVLAAALSAAGQAHRLPNGYTLRNRSLLDTSPVAQLCGLGPASGIIVAGDVLICRVSPCQFHIAIAASDGGFVHAHAGLRRVVVTPDPLPWPIIQHWRLRAAD
jgi:cell wall-associated NlpC family hydrolase